MGHGKIKICLITGGHWASVMGGAQYQVKCILDELAKDKLMDIYYLARNINHNFQPKGYDLQQITNPNYIRKFSFMFDYKDLYKCLEAISPDVIYQRGLQPYTGMAARYAKSKGCKFIFHIAHDFDVQPKKYLSNTRIPFLRFIEKKYSEYGLRNATNIIAQTNFQSELIKQNYGIDVDEVVPNFHPKPVREVNKKNRVVNIVWVANFKPVKQPEIFVKLVEDLQSHAGIKFIMVGRPGSKRYADLHSKIKLLPSLSYLGEQPIDSVNKILEDAHIFVNTSKAEGFANTFIQAWMRKVPVVSLSINTDDIFSDKKLGICSGSYEQLKDDVISLAADNELRGEMGEYAQKYSFKNHSFDNINKILSFMKI